MGIYTRTYRIFTEWNLRTCLDSSSDTIHHNAIIPPSRTIRVAWTPPAPGVLKLNFDGSVRHYSGTAGVVIRDHLGNNVISRSYNGTSSPLLAEAMALRNGLQLVVEHNIRHIFIEGDNLLIINILQGRALQCPWKIQMLMKDINQLLEHFETSSSRHI
ncbi:uncharacterized protein [Spinacia oleracea]|uniref:RNase H type-1 domain-containing protein n=1 Tax=Spinacia oleracea TaxID=3562 RepID=A0ABM3QPU2_SPIOL|nr:uncharacterized protein LOC130461343 [Spinacia oleracea]